MAVHSFQTILPKCNTLIANNINNIISTSLITNNLNIIISKFKQNFDIFLSYPQQIIFGVYDTLLHNMLIYFATEIEKDHTQSTLLLDKLDTKLSCLITLLRYLEAKDDKNFVCNDIINGQIIAGCYNSLLTADNLNITKDNIHDPAVWFQIKTSPTDNTIIEHSPIILVERRKFEPQLICDDLKHRYGEEACIVFVVPDSNVFNGNSSAVYYYNNFFQSSNIVRNLPLSLECGINSTSKTGKLYQSYIAEANPQAMGIRVSGPKIHILQTIGLANGISLLTEQYIKALNFPFKLQEACCNDAKNIHVVILPISMGSHDKDAYNTDLLSATAKALVTATSIYNAYQYIAYNTAHSPSGGYTNDEFDNKFGNMIIHILSDDDNLVTKLQKYEKVFYQQTKPYGIAHGNPNTLLQDLNNDIFKDLTDKDLSFLISAASVQSNNPPAPNPPTNPPLFTQPPLQPAIPPTTAPQSGSAILPPTIKNNNNNTTNFKSIFLIVGIIVLILTILILTTIGGLALKHRQHKLAKTKNHLQDIQTKQ